MTTAYLIAYSLSLAILGFGCWQDEDHIGRVSRLSRSCHPLLCSTRTIQKSLHLYMQQLQKLRWKKSKENIRGKKGLNRAEMDETRQNDPKHENEAERQNDPKFMLYWGSRINVFASQKKC